MGFDTLMLKKTAEYHQRGEMDLLKGLIFYVYAACFLISLTATLLIWYWDSRWRFMNGVQEQIFRLAIVILPGLVLLIVQQSSLAGLGKTTMGQIPEKIIRPLILVLPTAFIFFSSGRGPALRQLILIQIIAVWVACLLGLLMNYFVLRPRLKSLRPGFKSRSWTGTVVSLSILTILYALDSRVSLIFLGNLHGNSQVAVFNIAVKLTDLVGTPLLLMNMLIGPRIAGNWAQGKLDDIRKTLKQGTRLSFLLGLIPALVLLIFFRPILAYFGPEFLEGKAALWIMVGSQIFNLFCGSVGTLLLMTNHEREVLKSHLLSSGLNLLLCFLLIPAYGAIGAAWAAAASLVAWNGFLLLTVRNKLKINPTIFA
jgi:O-antigen/teichoic acid export membrane protein